PRLPQPHQLHRPIPTRDRRIQTPTTPCIGEEPLFLGGGQRYDGNRQLVTELNLPQVRSWGGSASADRPGTAMRNRSRRAELASPVAVDFVGYPLRTVNGAPDSAGEAPGCPESPRQDPPTGAARGPPRSSACRTRTRRARRPCAPRRSGPRQAPG